jgi:hypothetical protein
MLWFPPTSPLVDVDEVRWFCGVTSTCLVFLAAIWACKHCIGLITSMCVALRQITSPYSVFKNFVFFYFIKFMGKLQTDDFFFLGSTPPLFNAMKVPHHVRPSECICSQTRNISVLSFINNLHRIFCMQLNSTDIISLYFSCSLVLTL